MTWSRSRNFILALAPAPGKSYGFLRLQLRNTVHKCDYNMQMVQNCLIIISDSLPRKKKFLTFLIISAQSGMLTLQETTDIFLNFTAKQKPVLEYSVKSRYSWYHDS